MKGYSPVLGTIKKIKDKSQKLKVKKKKRKIEGLSNNKK